MVGAREELIDVAKALEHGVMSPVQAAGRIRTIVSTKLFRHKPDHRAPRKAVTTPLKRQQAVELRGRFPQASQLEIAASVGVNPGRVSEAIHSVKKGEPPQGSLL
jgi:hypothetical protein